MAYVLDANVFIDAKNRYYGFNLCPGFWKWLDIAFAGGVLLSVKQVRDELLQRDDKLALWCKSRSKMFVETNDKGTFESMKILSSWVYEHYQPAAQATFLGAADFALVAFACAHNHTVVTTEVEAGGLQVKIPNACNFMEVKHINPFEMLTAEKVKFHFNT